MQHWSWKSWVFVKKEENKKSEPWAKSLGRRGSGGRARPGHDPRGPSARSSSPALAEVLPPGRRCHRRCQALRVRPENSHRFQKQKDMGRAQAQRGTEQSGIRVSNERCHVCAPLARLRDLSGKRRGPAPAPVRGGGLPRTATDWQGCHGTAPS